MLVAAFPGQGWFGDLSHVQPGAVALLDAKSPYYVNEWDGHLFKYKLSRSSRDKEKNDKTRMATSVYLYRVEHRGSPNLLFEGVFAVVGKIYDSVRLKRTGVTAADGVHHVCQDVHRSKSESRHHTLLGPAAKHEFLTVRLDADRVSIGDGVHVDVPSRSYTPDFCLQQGHRTLLIESKADVGALRADFDGDVCRGGHAKCGQLAKQIGPNFDVIAIADHGDAMRVFEYDPASGAPRERGGLPLPPVQTLAPVQTCKS